MKRSYYANTVREFLLDPDSSILGELVKHHNFALEDLQRNAWISQIQILKQSLIDLKDNAFILFEYAIPRMGKRVDVILLVKGFVFVLEFKIGETKFPNYAIEQVLDYSLDLKNFHEQSRQRHIIPVVIATEATFCQQTLVAYDDLVYFPLKVNRNSLKSVLRNVITDLPGIPIDFKSWQQSAYKPTPTIVEAAQALYRGHDVSEISRSDSGVINLRRTSSVIGQIIDESKKHNKKSICFITGVPGSGKTLAGLNIATERRHTDVGEHAVFLSGNGPLVMVLQEALARSEVKKINNSLLRIKKKEALAKTRSFIQNIHHFRDDLIQTEQPPFEKVVIFDEAQRAWTLEQTSRFMSRKNRILDFSMSEPEFLISVMDRHKDYAVIICLVGGGQEINTGEAGLPEWFSSLASKYPHWHVYTSGMLTDTEYTGGSDIYSAIDCSKLHVITDLHLSVSVRSFRSEKVSEFVKNVIDNNKLEAETLFGKIKRNYPICITRNIETARKWLKKQARGSERIGLIASSGAYRLRPYGIHVRARIEPKHWFLNDKRDIRSSFCLEEVATEFDIQGLELDWACVAWDADFSFNNSHWEYRRFHGSNWQNINNLTKQRYLKNAYRVLLTRARQGMIIFIPEGSNEDPTRNKEFYDSTYNYLKEIGLETV